MGLNHFLSVALKTLMTQWDVYSDIANGYGYLESRIVNRTYKPAWYEDGLPEGCYLDENIKNGEDFINGTLLLGEGIKNGTMHCTEQDIFWGASCIALVQAPMLLGGAFVMSWVIVNEFSSEYASELKLVLATIPLMIIPFPLMVLAVQLLYLLKPKHQLRTWNLTDIIVILVSLEAAGEAGPQALLQLYIIFSDHEREWKLLTVVSLVSSIFTIAKASISLWTTETHGGEKRLSAGEPSAVVSFYTSTLRFIPIFATSFIFRTTATSITLILFQQFAFVPLSVGAIMITILSLFLNKGGKMDYAFHRSIEAFTHGFGGFAVLANSFWGERYEVTIPIMISAVVWQVIHSISLLVITVMVAIPKFHLQHWKNIARIPFLRQDSLYIFYIVIGVVILVGLLNVFLIWFQIYSVDWVELDHDVKQKMRWIRGEVSEDMPEIGCVEPYLRMLEKKVLSCWASLREQPLACCKAINKKVSCSCCTKETEIENKQFDPESQKLTKINEDYSTLTIQGPKFVSSSCGDIPPNAFPVKLYKGETFFVAQVKHQGWNIPGYLAPSMERAFASWNLEGIEKVDYSVLVQEPGEHNLYWMDATEGSLDSLGAVSLGTTPYGDTIYVGRAQVDEEWCIGKVTSRYNACFIGSRKIADFGLYEDSLEEYEVKEYQVLCSKTTAKHTN